jgi:hypothetical protein
MSDTGKIDKLIEQKVDQKIRLFTKSITDQIKEFLTENGDFHGDYLYQPMEFELYNQELRPINFKYHKMYVLHKSLLGGLELTIKDKMIERDTKELLEKIELLS